MTSNAMRTLEQRTLGTTGLTVSSIDAEESP